MARTTNDAMQRIDPILNDGWWMSLTSPWRNGDYWFCGLTPKGATGWNGRPDIEASGETAPEAIENCCKKWEEWRERIAPAAGADERIEYACAACDHLEDAHAPGYGCQGKHAVAPGVYEWCQCTDYVAAPAAGSERSE